MNKYPRLTNIVLSFIIVIFGCIDLSIASEPSQKQEINFPPLPKLKKPALFLGPAGEIFNFVTCEKGKLVFTIAESIIPPGMGPLPHIHHYTNEWFYASEGGITLFYSDKQYESVENPPAASKGTQATVYLHPLQPKRVLYGPKYYVHGFSNTDGVNRPLTFVWKPDPSSPPFPYKDGGIREYFEAVAQPIIDPNNLPPINDKNRQLFVTEAPKFGINQSFYFLQYVNQVEPKVPASMPEHTNETDLNEILAAMKEYNAGSKEVTCR